MFIKKKKFKRYVFIVLTVLLSISLVIPLAALFQDRSNEGVTQSAQSISGRQAELERMLEDNPNDPATLLELGQIYRQLSQAEQSLKTFAQVLTIDPNHAEARYNVALAYYSEGKHDQALEHLDIILKNNPSDEEACLLNAYVLGTGKKDYGAGVRALENYIAIAQPGPSVEMAKQNIDKWQALAEQERQP